MINSKVRIPLQKIIERLQPVIDGETQAFLVGGVVRDALLGRKTHDIDVTLQGDAESVSKRIANLLGGAFYPLDVERGTYRIIVTEGNGEREIIDIAALRGDNIIDDLRSRDFTINAIAVNVNEPNVLIDPFQGIEDVKEKKIRACTEHAFVDDPIRILRAIRQSSALGFQIELETIKYLKDAVQLLPLASAERLRDELFRLFDSVKPAAAIESLDTLGALRYLLPELEPLKGLEQSAPHMDDVWRHSLNTVRNLISILEILSVGHNPNLNTNWYDGFLSLKLGRYREKLHQHILEFSGIDRSYRSLMVFAALYHDVGKKMTWTQDQTGRIRFLEHEHIGGKLIRKRARLLRLSNVEIDHLGIIIKNHLRPILLANSGVDLSRRAIYRFFRSCGSQGVDVCLLSLADVKATYGAAMPQEIWMRQVNTVRKLLDAWWVEKDEVVEPPNLLSGKDLIEIFALEEGPMIGKLLADLQEAQAIGDVTNREDALSYVRKKIITK